jgi:hypothetical protein
MVHQNAEQGTKDDGSRIDIFGFDHGEARLQPFALAEALQVNAQPSSEETRREEFEKRNKVVVHFAASNRHAVTCPDRTILFLSVQQKLLTRSQFGLQTLNGRRTSDALPELPIRSAGTKRRRPFHRAAQRV